MRPHPIRLAAGALGAAFIALLLAGCGERLTSVLRPAAPPQVHFTDTRLLSGGADATFHLAWEESSPGGRVDHFLVAVNPASLDRLDAGWTASPERERTVAFARRAMPGAARPMAPGARDFDLVAVRAVDDRGTTSLPIWRAFFGEDIAPTVTITSPQPSALIFTTMPPSFWVHFQGSDPDGPNGLPAQYKFKLFEKGVDPAFDAYLSNPDSIRRQFAPAFAGWDSVSGDSTEVHFANLTIGHEYMFVITALDAQGAYTPVFSLNTNVLVMFVASATVLGPQITMFNDFFSYQYPSGGFSTDSSRIVHVEAPADRPLTVNWFARPQPTVALGGYRWALDIANLDDQTLRRNKNDLSHWTPWNLSTTSATLGPFHGPALDVPHRLYIEAMDQVGLVSLGILQFTFVSPTFDKDLLIVNDTRYNVDQRVRTPPPTSPDSVAAPIGAWPDAAELDTFLFAVGGVRWRMTPTGTLSPAGIFQGYRFDTLGTRQGLENPTIPLDVLGRYRHVVWLVDGYGSLFAPGEIGGGPTNPVMQMTTLRYMSSPNRQNTLAQWVQSGGQLWGLGGGFGNATNASWNNRSNDANGIRTYSSVGPQPDLTPGRFMYDLAHWQSEFRVFGPVQGLDFARLDRPDPSYYPDPNQKALAWPGEPFTGPFAGLYTSRLPTLLRPKSPALDPRYPNRYVADFYAFNVYTEFISAENRIIQPVGGEHGQVRGDRPEFSTLDTLYLVYGPQYPGKLLQPGEGVNATMTVYRGGGLPPLVNTGFDVWHFTRQDCVSLVDFVLNGMWGLSRTGAAGPVSVRSKGR